MFHIQLIRDNQGIQRVVFSEVVMNGSPEIKARVCTTVETYLGAVAEIVRRGQGEGVIRADLEADSVSVAFLGMIQPAAILWHLSAGKFDLTGHAERAWKIFLGGVLPKNTMIKPG